MVINTSVCNCAKYMHKTKGTMHHGWWEKSATRTFEAGVKRKIKHTKYFPSNIEGNYYNLTNSLRYLCVYILCNGWCVWSLSNVNKTF